jgi:hypothetical protein
MTGLNWLRRRCRVTATALAVAVLFSESFLWLSDRSGWFGLDHRMGWAVLAAVALVSLAAALFLLWLVLSVLFRRRFQFTMSFLVLLAPIVALACGWLTGETESATRQREAVRALEAAANDAGQDRRFRRGPRRVQYDYEIEHTLSEIRAGPGCKPTSCPSLAPTWLCNRLGVDFFARALEVSANERPLSDADMAHLEALSALEALSVAHGAFTQMASSTAQFTLATIDRSSPRELIPRPPAAQRAANGRALSCDHRTQVTDSGLRHLRGLTRLRALDLSDTAITDTGLRSLGSLTQLRTLDLGETAVTDAGMEVLRRFTHLRFLYLDGTAITDKGLESLQDLTDLFHLDLSHTHVTDEGLRRLRRITRLRVLHLEGTNVTGAGLYHLGSLAQLRYLGLAATAFGDEGLEPIMRLPSLWGLDASSTRLDDEAIPKLISLRHLGCLFLLRSRITSEGRDRLAAALPNCMFDGEDFPIEFPGTIPPGQVR